VRILGINVSHNNLQASKLGNYISSLRYIKNDLDSFKSNLSYGWQAKEMTYINNAINDITKEINKLTGELDRLSNDIVLVGQEIKQEEDEKEAAEKVKLQAQAQNILQQK
jgi:archaellum component FlaC